MWSTFVNETSSRSYLLLLILIEQIDKNGKSTICKITNIDLSGSESLSEIGVDPFIFKEGMQINESLICLGCKMRQAAYGFPPAFYLHPLTEIMLHSLGGNYNTMMISCISPSIYDIAQTR